MIEYDEARNVELIGRLPGALRVVFALLCALRLLPAYRRYHERTGRGSPDELDSLLERLWNDAGTGELTDDEVRVAAQRVLELVPSEDDEPWDEKTQAYAEDAAAALAYAFRTRLTNDPQEAAWAARRLFEAADHFARIQCGADQAADEPALLAHPCVQAELMRQSRDLHELSTLASPELVPEIHAMRERSEKEAAQLFSPG